MKKIIGIFALSALIACGGGETETKNDDLNDTPSITTDVVTNETNNEVTSEVSEEKSIVESVDAAIMDQGKTIYSNCLACHMEHGEGITSVFPPLANSDYMLENTDRLINTIINGTKEAITVNGVEYPGSTMTTFGHLSDDEIAAVSTFVLNSWGNDGGLVTADMVFKNR